MALPRFLRVRPRAPRAHRLPPRAHRLPPGQRIYAIGDVHGRADCLTQLIGLIEDDAARRGKAATTLVFLGDLVDRGPQSRQVVEGAMMMARATACVFLLGNHEEVMLRAWEGDVAAMRSFHNMGGRETLLSYGVDERRYDDADTETLTRWLGKAVPPEHAAFLRGFGDTYAAGDWLFVHAGIRPGVPLAQQSAKDLRWIRREFLDDTRDHGPMIVHGHSVTREPDIRPNRIGIDTGAFASGRLTALGIEGDTHWLLST